MFVYLSLDFLLEDLISIISDVQGCKLDDAINLLLGHASGLTSSSGFLRSGNTIIVGIDVVEELVEILGHLLSSSGGELTINSVRFKSSTDLFPVLLGNLSCLEAGYTLILGEGV